VLNDLHDRYDMKHHTQSGSPQSQALTPKFIDEYAIVGSPAVCIERLRSLARLGVERVIVIGPSAGSDRDQAIAAERHFVEEIIPEIRARPN
jgi:5,10-methylenetetrahydromethanopterin reductase